MSDQPNGYMKVLDEELQRQKNMKDYEWIKSALENETSNINHKETILALCSLYNRLTERVYELENYTAINIGK